MRHGEAAAAAGSAIGGSRIGIDLVPEMLLEARRRTGGGLRMAAADVRALPFADASFDLVWCRLALGHLHDLDDAYRELARASEAGATVVVTDFHPGAAAAGYVRSFQDAGGTLRAVQHFPHDPAEHRRAAEASGLTFRTAEDLVVGPAARPYYEAAGRARQYREQCGRPMVLLLAFER